MRETENLCLLYIMQIEKGEVMMGREVTEHRGDTGLLGRGCGCVNDWGCPAVLQSVTREGAGHGHQCGREQRHWAHRDHGNERETRR